MDFQTQAGRTWPPSPTRALAAALCALVLGAPACAGDQCHSDLDPNVAVPPPGSWYRPQRDTTWQWQLLGSVHTSHEAQLYDVDLFDSDVALIDSLHAEGRKVICYFSAGSSENWRSDFGQFNKASMGEPLEGWDGERWLDVRCPAVFQLMVARLELAKAKGCDGVEPDNVDGWQNKTGFDLTGQDQLAFNRGLANEAHRLGLSVGLKNDLDQVAALVAYFDFSVAEQCHEFGECARLAPFVQAGKPVFNAEYTATATAAAELAKTVCPQAASAGLRTLILPLKLDDTFRVVCD